MSEKEKKEKTKTKADEVVETKEEKVVEEKTKKENVSTEKVEKKEEKKAKKEQKKLEKEAKGNEGKIVVVIVALVIIVALAIFGYFLYNKDIKPVVKFEGGSVNATDYEIYYRTFAPMLQYYGYDADGIASLIAEKAASDKITVAAAKKAGVKISDEDKAYVDEIFADEEQVQTFVQSGIDPTRMKQFYYNDYLMDGYIQKLKQDLPDEEVKQYILSTYGEDVDMREYVTKHILFAKYDLTTGDSYSDEELATIRSTAESVLAKALNGEDFETLVTEYSDDEGTVKNGGEYRVYMDDNTVEEFTNAVATLNVGQIHSTLVETTYGYHIIKLVEYNEEGRVHSDLERETIAYEKLDELIENANIEIKTDIMNETVEKITGVSEDAESETEVEEEHDHSTEEETDTTETDTTTDTTTDDTTIVTE